MADEEKLKQFFLLLDSDQPGERRNALEKIHSMRVAAGWPSFGDIFRALENTAPRAEFEALKTENAKWIAAHEALSMENGKIARELTELRTARQMSKKARAFLLAGACAVALIGSASYALASWGVFSTTQDNEKKAFYEMVTESRWAIKNSIPVVRFIAGSPYWVLLHPESDDNTHTSIDGRPILRHCLYLYATKAQPDGQSYLTPRPYWLFGISWPEVASTCQEQIKP